MCVLCVCVGGVSPCSTPHPGHKNQPISQLWKLKASGKWGRGERKEILTNGETESQEGELRAASPPASSLLLLCLPTPTPGVRAGGMGAEAVSAWGEAGTQAPSLAESPSPSTPSHQALGQTLGFQSPTGMRDELDSEMTSSGLER